MFWLTNHGLDGAAFLSRSPTARPLTRMPLNGVRWMDCDLDQAGGPTTTPHPHPCRVKLTCMRTQRHTLTNVDTHTGWCTYTSSSEGSVHSCKVKHGKEEANYPPDRWLEVGSLIIFSAEGFNAAGVGCRQLVSSSLPLCLCCCPL